MRCIINILACEIQKRKLVDDYDEESNKVGVSLSTSVLAFEALIGIFREWHLQSKWKWRMMSSSESIFNNSQCIFVTRYMLSLISLAVSIFNADLSISRSLTKLPRLSIEVLDKSFDYFWNRAMVPVVI